MNEAKIVMPRMGTSVHEGTIIQWLKGEGDLVCRGEPVLLADSEKVEFEVESPCNGRLAKILVPPETTVPVGQALAVIETEETVVQSEERDTESPGPETDGVVPAYAPLPRPETREDGGNRFISPRIRRLARDHGIPLEELRQIPGTGRGGRVTQEDFEAFLKGRQGGEKQSPPTVRAEVPPADAEAVPLTRLRKRLAERLTASVRDLPQFTTFDEADVTDVVLERRSRAEGVFARRGIHLTYTHFVAWAVLRALEQVEFRPLNARFGGDVMYLFRNVHLGIATAVPEGLLVPVIRDAESKTFSELAREIQEMADHARQGTLSPAQVTGSTFTISNVGSAGSLYATPIVNPPEAAILGVGVIRKSVVPLEDGSIGVREKMGVSLTVDHRLVDGMLAAQFNRAVCRNLEEFDFSVLDG